NFTKVSLLQVLQETETGLYVQSNHLIKNTENGIELICKSNINGDGKTGFDGHIYVRTLIASEIALDMELTLVVSVTFEEDEKETTKVESITLVTTETAGVFVDIDGQNYAYIVKGSSVTPRSKVIGFTNPVTYKLSQIEPTYENFVYYFDPSFTQMLKKEDITEEQIELLFNDQIRVNSVTGETYVGVLIKKGVVLTIEASVTEYMNNGIRIGSDSVNLYVVDYKIAGIKVQNAVNNTLTAICNIPKTLKVDFVVDRREYVNYEYEYLQDVLPVSIYKNVARAVELFFGVNTNFKSEIDIELEELLRTINTYENGVWLYTNDAITSQIRRYKTIVVGEYYNDLFEVQTSSYEANSNLTCFALRLKEKTIQSFRASVNLTFNFNSQTNSVTYTFNPLFDATLGGENVLLEYDFNVEGVDSSSQDNPLPIYDQDKFMEYVFTTEDVHYILLTDIVLEDWTPQDTKVASLDGNGYTITIKSFAESKEEIAYYGLFKTISENTILTNVTVQYSGDMEIKTTTQVGTVNVGLFAYENKGTLFNCAVVGSGETNIDVTTNATSVKNGLFVVNNTSTGSISNSRVGYIDGIGEKGNVIHFASYNSIAGFAVKNDGHIASSFAKNISLLSKDITDDTTSEIGVAGFVENNTSSGEIYFSYVEGIRGESQDTQIGLSKQGFRKYNTGIYSPGIIAGFVFKNTGYIQDTYTNIPLLSPTTSTGFVYINTADGKITNAFSTCLQPTTLDDGQEEHPNTSRSPFTGINDLNELQNNGVIEYAYYYNYEYDSNIYDELGEPALALPPDAFHDSLEEFGNFVGGENMIWEVDALHPQLVSANRIIKRQRYLVNNLTGSEDDETLESYIYYYEDKVDGEHDVYGSYTNPIIISSGTQFVAMGDETRLTTYTNTSTDTTVRTTLNQNDYIVIKDIDVSTVIDTGLEDLQSITYAGMLEGNGYTFKNVSILSEKSSKLSGVSFGMFEQIGATVLFENDVLKTVDTTDYHSQIKNLTIEINAISGTHATAVGTLAGVIVNSDIVNINLLSKSTDGEKVTVQGERYVGSVAGYVAGDSTIINITSDLSVSSEFRNKGTDINQINPYIMSNNSISNSIYAYKFEIDTKNYTGGYAGGIAGLVDCFTLKLTKNADTMFASITRFDYDKVGYNYVAVNFAPQISSVTVKG
ncbi:MAG: hypothetical protein IJW82_07680, partial [Clostridia bacterium]|nr:hypothetical protein [Clostridia bacterium]